MIATGPPQNSAAEGFRGVLCQGGAGQGFQKSCCYSCPLHLLSLSGKRHVWSSPSGAAFCSRAPARWIDLCECSLVVIGYSRSNVRKSGHPEATFTCWIHSFRCWSLDISIVFIHSCVRVVQLGLYKFHVELIWCNIFLTEKTNKASATLTTAISPPKTFLTTLPSKSWANTHTFRKS